MVSHVCALESCLKFFPSLAPINDDMAEPFYIEPIKMSENSELYESIEAQMYEVPTTSLKKQSEDESEHAYHVLEAAMDKSRDRGTEEDNYDSDDYQTMGPPPSPSVADQEKGREGEEMEEHDYQELERPSNLTVLETEQDEHFSAHDRLHPTLKVCFNY